MTQYLEGGKCSYHYIFGVHPCRLFYLPSDDVCPCPFDKYQSYHTSRAPCKIYTCFYYENQVGESALTVPTENDDHHMTAAADNSMKHDINNNQRGFTRYTGSQNIGIEYIAMVILSVIASLVLATIIFMLYRKRMRRKRLIRQARSNNVRNHSIVVSPSLIRKSLADIRSDQNYYTVPPGRSSLTVPHAATKLISLAVQPLGPPLNNTKTVDDPPYLEDDPHGRSDPHQHHHRSRHHGGKRESSASSPNRNTTSSIAGALGDSEHLTPMNPRRRSSYTPSPLPDIKIQFADSTDTEDQQEQMMPLPVLNTCGSSSSSQNMDQENMKKADQVSKCY